MDSSLPDPIDDPPPPAATLPVVAAIGFAMGAADLVPGVSGGTVALVAGIYERLVSNIRTGAGAIAALGRGQRDRFVAGLRTVEWGFLLTLLAGILVAVFSLAGLLRRLLDDEPVLLSAVFLGLVLAATVVAAAELRRPSVRHGMLGLTVAGATFVALGVRGGSIGDPSLPIFFIGGALAVCAMILPGISGSFLLLLVGLYDGVIAAIDERDLVTIAVVGAGAAIGLGAFSTALHALLRRAHDLVLAGLIGLMLGSIRVLWPWPAGPDGVADTGLGAPVSDEVLPTTIAGIVSFALVMVLTTLARRVTVPAATSAG